MEAMSGGWLRPYTSYAARRRNSRSSTRGDGDQAKQPGVFAMHSPLTVNKGWCSSYPTFSSKKLHNSGRLLGQLPPSPTLPKIPCPTRMLPCLILPLSLAQMLSQLQMFSFLIVCMSCLMKSNRRSSVGFQKRMLSKSSTSRPSPKRPCHTTLMLPSTSHSSETVSV